MRENEGITFRRLKFPSLSVRFTLEEVDLEVVYLPHFTPYDGERLPPSSRSRSERIGAIIRNAVGPRKNEVRGHRSRCCASRCVGVGGGDDGVGDELNADGLCVALHLVVGCLAQRAQ